MTTSWKEEGIIEGKAEGVRESTLMILERRFGPVPDLIVQPKEPGQVGSTQPQRRR